MDVILYVLYWLVGGRNILGQVCQSATLLNMSISEGIEMGW